MPQHPTRKGQLVRFIPNRNNELCPDDAVFKVVHYYVDEDDEAFVRIIPVPKSSRGYGISRHINRYASRFQVVSQRISYTKDIHGTIHNRPTPRPISSNERDRTSESLSPRGVSMDSFADGFVSCESTPLRELSIDPISVASRLREAISEDSRPNIRQDFFQWARGLIDNVSNRRTEIPRPNHAAEARRLEGNQSARYQRNSTTRHPVSSDVQESRSSWSSVLWGEGSTMGLSGETFRYTDYFTNAYSNYFSRATMCEEVDLRSPVSTVCYSSFER